MTYDDALEAQQRKRHDQIRRGRPGQGQKVVPICTRMKAKRADVFDFDRLMRRDPVSRVLLARR